MTDDTTVVIEAVAGWTIAPRQRRWTHLSLCVLDAVYSIVAHYDRHTVPTVRRYATFAGLPEPVLPAGRAHEIVGTDREQSLDVLGGHIAALGVEAFAGEVLGNRQRTSTRTGSPRKTEAVRRYTEILTAHGIRTLTDAAALTADDQARPEVETQLRKVPGNGMHDVRLDYLWMLVGDDQRIKPDRMVLRWLDGLYSDGRRHTPSQARALLTAAATQLGCSPWELDHAIWKHARGS